MIALADAASVTRRIALSIGLRKVEEQSTDEKSISKENRKKVAKRVLLCPST